MDIAPDRAIRRLLLGTRAAPVAGAFRAAVAAALYLQGAAAAQAQTPSLVDPNLQVRTVVEGLQSPTSMAFLGPDDFLVLEKATGRVLRVTDGIIQGAVLDLPVNSASERGLLGIALHPEFPANAGVYLFWSESTTGADTTDVNAIELLGNRVDRFRWDGNSLTFEQNLIRLRAFQHDEGQNPRGNHNGGVIKFGPDGKLYIYIGDTGRRGQMQNLPDGPGPDGNSPDDQFGGPEPDDAHLTGVILRLNDDGSAPEDNPFHEAGALRGGEVGANLQKVFAYGVRNGFGMDFDPVTGALWEAQNGDDTFTEVNLVEPGANLGWVQIMGPLSRLGQYKGIETSEDFFGLQQLRWSPTNIVDTPEELSQRLFMVYDGGDQFAAELTGAEEVPPVATDASALATFVLNADGTLSYQLVATGPISQARVAHIHLGGRGQNGPTTVFLYGPTDGEDFEEGDIIAEGVITDTDVISRGPFQGGISNLVWRMRDGRTYVNLHTIEHSAGEIRGQIVVTDREPVSHYNDPELSWRYEVAPAAVGFVATTALGPEYEGDMIIGAARAFLFDGHLFRLRLSADRSAIEVSDERLADGVVDNIAKHEFTESESLLFGTGFGVGSDIRVGPNGNLFVVSLSNGAVYEISRRQIRPIGPGSPGFDPSRGAGRRAN